MIFKCWYCPIHKVGRHDRTAHVERFVCIACKRKGLKPPPLPGEKTFVKQSPVVDIRSFMRPKQVRRKAT